MVPKILCLSCMNIWSNILDPDRKIQAVIRVKVDSKWGICSDFEMIFLDGCRDDKYELVPIDMYMNLTLFQLQDLPCYSIVLIIMDILYAWLKFLVPYSSFPTLIFSSAIFLGYSWKLCETWNHHMWVIPITLEDKNHLQRIWMDRYGEMDR